MFDFKPIGYVQSCYPDKFGTPRQPGLVPDAKAFLKLLPEVQPEISLTGLNEFSHLWVIFVFHKNNSARFHAKVHPPRLGGETRGAFATRSPHRPNPIGLSLVKILSVEADGVWVSGVDLIQDTPILDIKPYLPQIESKSDAIGGWSDNPSHPQFSIEWDQKCLDTLASAVSNIQFFASNGKQSLSLEQTTKLSFESLKSLIEKTIQLDPRPLVYRGYEGEESPYRDSHAVRIYNLDVHFNFASPTNVKIEKIIVLK